MTVRELAAALDLSVLTGNDHLDREVTGGYASDLLSCVMAGARAGDVWVTLQAHANVVAVASLLTLAAVVITEGVRTQPRQRRQRWKGWCCSPRPGPPLPWCLLWRGWA